MSVRVILAAAMARMHSGTNLSTRQRVENLGSGKEKTKEQKREGKARKKQATLSKTSARREKRKLVCRNRFWPIVCRDFVALR
ncbi:uncharacterized protein VTP21DRAFT_7751 [Calcarisporiella thermophila]|uniref:uncharacterized protein n=1 Tax=Calcarisporiella thermophila TaxID=911321 RepID=UPI003744260F